MDLKKLMNNPVRIQILQYLGQTGEATTRQIAEAMPDVPQPTLYRHVGGMLKDGLLLVKAERKVRGSVERLLTVNAEALEAQCGERIADTAGQFLLGLYASFQTYADAPDADPVRDMLMLRTCFLKLTDQSYANFLMELGELIQTYMKAEDRINGKVRRLSMISSPVIGEEST